MSPCESVYHWPLVEFCDQCRNLSWDARRGTNVVAFSMKLDITVLPSSCTKMVCVVRYFIVPPAIVGACA